MTESDCSMITFIIDNKVYKLSADDLRAINEISDDHKEKLITLLSAVKKSHQSSLSSIPSADEKIIPIHGNPSSGLSASSDHLASSSLGSIKGKERLSESDTNELVARLIMQEKQQQKPGLSKKSIYKVFGFFVICIVLLILIF